MNLRLLITASALLLGGCEIPGLGPDAKVLQRESDAKSIGGACRHGLRSIEDCYNLNPTATKTSVFNGWKEMDQYMRENKIEGILATIPKPEPVEEVIEESPPKAQSSAKTYGRASH